MVIVRQAMERLQDGHRAARQRDAVGMAGLHASGWNCPDGFVQVKLAPVGIEDFAGPGGGEDGEFKRQRCRRFASPQCCHKGGKVVIGQGRMMAPGEPLAGRENGFQMTPPARRVFAGQEALAFAASSMFSMRLRSGWLSRERRRDRLQNLQDCFCVDGVRRAGSGSACERW